MSTQVVKKITIGAEARDIAAKYDIYGKEIDIDSLATKADMNTDFVQIKNLVTINNRELVADGGGNIVVEAEVSKKAEWLPAVTSFDATIGTDNHFVIHIIESTISSSSDSATFKINNIEESLAYGYWQPGAKIEVFNNVAICTNNLGNTVTYVSPQKTLSILSIKDLPEEATLSLVVFQENVNLTGFNPAEEEEEGGEE